MQEILNKILFQKFFFEHILFNEEKKSILNGQTNKISKERTILRKRIMKITKIDFKKIEE